MQTYPLLDIEQAAKDADRNLVDIVTYVQTLQSESDGQYPPGAETVLVNVAMLREVLAEVFPSELKKAIAQEHKQYEEDEGRWGG